MFSFRDISMETDYFQEPYCGDNDLGKQLLKVNLGQIISPHSED